MGKTRPATDEASPMAAQSEHTRDPSLADRKATNDMPPHLGQHLANS